MNAVMNGKKVIDLSWGIAGPMISMLLADHGADVTRIERPQGDPFSYLLGYKVWNRGKKNAVFDLKDENDLELFYKLVGEADVLVESFSPSVTKRLKIDYLTLSKLNPKLVYCSITGYGVGTKDSHHKGYDTLVAARSGLQYEQRGWPEGSLYHMSNMEDPYPDLEVSSDWVQGANREGPLASASKWPSLGAFFSASVGISAALYVCEKTGVGQHVQTSLLQGAMACATGVWQRAENIDEPFYNTWIMGSKSPKGHFQTSDGQWVHNWVPNPRFILEAAKGESLDASPDLTVQNDPDRFGIGPEELLVMEHYQPILADAMKKFPADEWVKAAEVAGVTAQKCRSIEDSLIDPLLIGDNCVTTIDDPELGKINQVGITYRLETSPGKIQGPTRPTGADTDAVKQYAATLKMPTEQDIKNLVNEAPLKGIRVLDLGMAIAGPFGCQLLADLGAEVIKVNTLWDMFWHSTHIAFMANRGKRSIALNLKEEKGMEIVKKLIKSCDVVQHNMRYAAVERAGLDYESLKTEFPEMIYCHTRGFEKGARMNLPGNDQTAACLSGIQYSDGALHDKNGFPLWSLVSLGDTGNGFLSAVAIMNALMEREKTGKGQFVDTSIINAALLNTSYAVAKPDGTAFKRPLLDANQTGFGIYHRLYKTADQEWIQIAAHSEKERQKFINILGLTGDIKETDAEYTFSQKTAKEWMKHFETENIPAEISDKEASRLLFDNQDYKDRNWTVKYQHHTIGSLEQIGSTYDLSATPGCPQDQKPPLSVGDNTVSLLKELGYSEDEIGELADYGIVMCDPEFEKSA